MGLGWAESGLYNGRNVVEFHKLVRHIFWVTPSLIYWILCSSLCVCVCCMHVCMALDQDIILSHLSCHIVCIGFFQASRWHMACWSGFKQNNTSIRFYRRPPRSSRARRYNTEEPSKAGKPWLENCSRDMWKIEECHGTSGDGALWISLQHKAWDSLPLFSCFIITNLIQTPADSATCWCLLVSSEHNGNSSRGNVDIGATIHLETF